MNILKLIILLILICFANVLLGQSVKEIKLENSSTNNYYVVEPKGEIKGVMVLLPGGSYEPTSIFPETKLHNVAYLHNILTVAMDYGKTTLYVNENVLYRMNTALIDVMERYKIPKDKFVMGGYSAGGITSLCYTIHSKKFPEETVIEPQGVFTADAPVDLSEIWYYLRREIKKNFSELAVNEAKYFLPYLEKDMNGTPENNFENYIKHSPYTHRSDDGGNVKYLLDTPVRLHHDPDVVWRLENRRQDFFDMNEPYASAMINWLMLNGNDKAQFVVSKSPAMMSNGNRNTHAWSVIEEVSCVLWVKKCLGIE